MVVCGRNALIPPFIWCQLRIKKPPLHTVFYGGSIDITPKSVNTKCMVVDLPRPRGEHGQFIKVGRETNDETLVDVKVNNPLHKIVELLQDIKKQKAFSFTLKGSVGIMGVSAIVLGTGAFGGSRILCNKGSQTKIGVVRVLSVTQTAQDHPLRAKIGEIIGRSYKTETTKAVILMDANKETMNLVSKRKGFAEGFEGQEVMVTGQYNACMQELSVMGDGISLLGN